MVLAGLFEQRDQPLNFAGGIFVRFFRVGGVFLRGVDQHGEGLGDAVEDQQLVGNEKIHDRRLQLIMGGPGHDRLDIMNEFVADKTDRAAGEARQPRHRHRAIFPHHPLDHFETVLHLLRIGRSIRHRELLDDFAVFNQLDAIGGLANDCARIAADKGIAAEMFAAFDRFKQERLARPANLAVRGQRRFDISQQPARNGNEISLRSQLGELFEGGRVHSLEIPFPGANEIRMTNDE